MKNLAGCNEVVCKYSAKFGGVNLTYASKFDEKPSYSLRGLVGCFGDVG